MGDFREPKNVFQRAMEEILDGIEDILIYIDYILIGGHNEIDLKSKRIRVLNKLKEFNLTINDKKTLYSKSKHLVFGYFLQHGSEGYIFYSNYVSS